MSEPLLTVAQVAERVRLSEWAIRRAIADGELAACKLRGRLRVAPASLEEWVRASRVKSTGRDRLEPPNARSPSPGCVTSFRDRVRQARP